MKRKPKVLINPKIIKKFVDPVFGIISSPRFQMSRIYLDGQWKAEMWDDTYSEEYHLSFKNFEGTKVTFIFPTSKDRLAAASHIIPDKELELPHDYAVIETISNNVLLKEKPKYILKLIVLGGAIVALGWTVMKRFTNSNDK